MNSKKIIFLAMAAALVICGSLIAFLWSDQSQNNLDVGGADGKLGGDFVLTGQQGPVSLSDYKGEAVVLYFGFTTCPEICPTSMRVISKAFKSLPEEALNKTQGIMVSVDPERDTLENLALYTEYFHPKIQGLLGTKAEVDAVAKDYGAFFEINDINTENYEYVHTSRYFIIDQQGNLVDAMRHGTTPNELRARIEEVLQSGDI